MSLHRCILALAIAAALLGAIHLALTPVIYPGWTIEALWFAGTGLAIVIAAAANIIGLAWEASVKVSGKHRGHFLTIAIDLIMAGFFGAAWLILAEPQVIAGGILFLGLGCCALANQFGRKHWRDS